MYVEELDVPIEVASVSEEQLRWGRHQGNSFCGAIAKQICDELGAPCPLGTEGCRAGVGTGCQ